MSGCTAKNMAVFIDADNLSNATALDHVFAELQSRAERISYRRAYGRPESLKTIEAVLWRHGVRPVNNLVTNKVTTDIALTIDAVEAVCRRGFDAVVICSGDADFVPLATWLREQGCFVLCFSLNNTLFANPESFYDEVVMLEVVQKPEPPAGPELPLVPAPTPAVAPLPAVSPEILPKPAFTPAPVAAPAFLVPMPSLPPAPSPSHQNAGTVQQVLQAFPALRSGEPQHLGQVVAALRQRGILAVGTKTTTWFAQWAAEFQLLPAQVPNQIVYKKPPAATPSKAVPAAAGMKSAAAKPVPTPALPWPTAVQPAPALPEEVERILQAVPALREAPQLLSQVVPVLRQKTILGKTTKSIPLFARHAAHFKLSPPGSPTHIAYTVPRPAAAPAVVSVAEKSAPRALQAMRSFPVAPTAAPAAALAPWPWKVPPVLDPQTAPPLLPELHGLRCVLLQLALRRMTVADLLRAVPEIMAGQLMDLGSVSKKLCDKGVVASSAHGRAVLMAYPSSFRLLPPEAPNAVQYIG